MEYLDRAAATFDGSPDFPVITGVFRLREILKAKLTAAKKLNLLPDAWSDALDNYASNLVVFSCYCLLNPGSMFLIKIKIYSHK